MDVGALPGVEVILIEFSSNLTVFDRVPTSFDDVP